MKIVCADGCGNAPRQVMLRDVNIAFAQGDPGPLLELMAEDVRFELVGQRQINGKPDVQAFFEDGRGPGARELHIHHIITHGKSAALQATMTSSDGTRYAYCDVYKFASAGKQARLKQVTSFCIREPS